MAVSTLERLAHWTSPGYLTERWVAANGSWSTPSENDLRAFLMNLSKETED